MPPEENETKNMRQEGGAPAGSDAAESSAGGDAGVSAGGGKSAGDEPAGEAAALGQSGADGGVPAPAPRARGEYPPDTAFGIAPEPASLKGGVSSDPSPAGPPPAPQTLAPDDSSSSGSSLSPEASEPGPSDGLVSEPQSSGAPSGVQTSHSSASPETKPAGEPPQAHIQEKTRPDLSPLQSSSLRTDLAPDPNFVQRLLVRARAKIQERRRKKLDKIMALFEAKPRITNRDIRRILRVSRATAVRYLDILERENRIKQVGNTGKSVFYTKI